MCRGGGGGGGGVMRMENEAESFWINIFDSILYINRVDC